MGCTEKINAAGGSNAAAGRGKQLLRQHSGDRKWWHRQGARDWSNAHLKAANNHTLIHLRVPQHMPPRTPRSAHHAKRRTSKAPQRHLKGWLAFWLALQSSLIQIAAAAAMACIGDVGRGPGLQELPTGLLDYLAGSLDLADRQAPLGFGRRRCLLASAAAPPPPHTVVASAPSAESAWRPHAAPCATRLCTGSATTSSSSGAPASQLKSMWHGFAECEVRPDPPPPTPSSPHPLRCNPATADLEVEH